jgi:uncharacterized membrane protein
MAIKEVIKDRRMQLLMAGFTCLYALISLVNHFLFKSYALDLGVYTNALWDYSHFQFNDSLSFKAESENLLADHFDLYLVLFSPISFLFGTYTLLILQIAAIIFGGVGVYHYFQFKGNNTLAFYASAFFYSFFGVFGAIAFDYHSNVVAACLLPWFLYSIAKNQRMQALLYFTLMLVAKENISLWVVFICIGLLLEYKKDREKIVFLTILALLALIYFLTILSFVMPAISNSAHYNHFDYSMLGQDIKEALLTLILHPLHSLKLLFINTTIKPAYDYVKLEFIVLMLISGFAILIKKPNYLIMTIPLFLQKFYNDNPNKWGIVGQYSIEFAPILAIGIFSYIGTLSSTKLSLRLSQLLVLLGAITTLRTMDYTLTWTQKDKLRFYQPQHYKKDYEVLKAHELLKTIPDAAIVSAQSPFLPHLALRDKVYQFPMIKDAEYIVFSNLENEYPMSKKEFLKFTDSLMKTSEFEVIHTRPITVLKRQAINK